MNEACQEFITTIAQAIDAEPVKFRATIKTPAGVVVGQQVVIDTAEPGAPMKRCKISIFDVGLAPAGEAARVEYEHDKKTNAGLKRVYSVQSVRSVDGQLALYENFMTDMSIIREEDFLQISSETYAKNTILKILKDWVGYRAWQLKGGK